MVLHIYMDAQFTVLVLFDRTIYQKTFKVLRILIQVKID